MSNISNAGKIDKIIYHFQMSGSGMNKVPLHSMVCIEKFIGNVPKYVIVKNNTTDNVSDWINDENNFSNLCSSVIYPIKITNFSATDNLENKITFTFTEEADVVFNLFKNNILLKSDIRSGYTHYGAAVIGTNIYYIEASNQFGKTISNIDQGTALPVTTHYPPGVPILDLISQGSSLQVIFNQVSGDQPIVYDLYRDNQLFRSNITSGILIPNTVEPHVYVLTAANAYGSSQSEPVIK